MMVDGGGVVGGGGGALLRCATRLRLKPHAPSATLCQQQPGSKVRPRAKQRAVRPCARFVRRRCGRHAGGLFKAAFSRPGRRRTRLRRAVVDAISTSAKAGAKIEARGTARSASFTYLWRRLRLITLSPPRAWPFAAGCSCSPAWACCRHVARREAPGRVASVLYPLPPPPVCLLLRADLPRLRAAQLHPGAREDEAIRRRRRILPQVRNNTACRSCMYFYGKDD